MFWLFTCKVSEFCRLCVPELFVDKFIITDQLSEIPVQTMNITWVMPSLGASGIALCSGKGHY